MMRNEIRTKKYDMDVLQFAQTLRFYSPKAYQYLRTYLELPTEATLNNHLRSFKCMPGIIGESLDELELHKGDPDYEVASLVLDEMSIKELIEFCPDIDKGRAFGGIDYGDKFNLEEADTRPANSALVCLLVGYKGNWKLPIAYFFTRGLKSGVQSGIIRECISSCHKIGVKIFNVTMDGTKHNVSAVEKLGTKIFVKELEDMKSSFPHPCDDVNYEVSVYLDPIHMVKLIRNTVCDYKVLIWPNRGNVKWEYIEKLHSLQDEHGLRAANKLSNQHINYKKKIMKVSLAVQTIASRSVAVALQ